jgi:hypothetical protein
MFTLMTKSVNEFAFVQMLFFKNLMRKKFRIICFMQYLLRYYLKILWTIVKLKIVLMALLPTTRRPKKTFNLLSIKWNIILNLITRESFNYSFDTVSRRRLKRYDCYYCFGLLRLYYLFLLVSLPRCCFSLAGKQTIYFIFDHPFRLIPK